MSYDVEKPGSHGIRLRQPRATCTYFSNWRKTDFVVEVLSCVEATVEQK